ncbi:MAG: 4Fe-4S dicluster domain-containing protein [Candidatus Zixiibacteriota bacterium]
MTTAIERFPQKEATLRAAFWEQVASIPDGHKIKECLQCGTCTGTCRVSYAMDITPRATVALFRAGLLEDILQSRTIWICASCYSCTVRCPSGIKVTDTMYALKRLAMNKRIYPQKFPVHALSRAFVDNVYKYGRNYELGLGIRYFMRSGWTKLFGQMGYGFSLMRRGRLKLLPRKIRRVNQVRAIIRRADQLGE